MAGWYYTEQSDTREARLRRQEIDEERRRMAKSARALDNRDRRLAGLKPKTTPIKL